jgi:DNA repair exonuclease SbcCD ATPase subunit
LAEQTAYGRSAGTAKDLRGQSDAWKRGKAAMLRLRVLVKQHLLPSLNAVASRLIEQMTGGQRRLIVVDDEFDIRVDGQPLATLSGSGKAVANLALRIGLGQVLTNNVLSLFIGDEIDASLDADRSEATGQTLRGLMSSVAQILLVTHKGAEAEYSVTL